MHPVVKFITDLLLLIYLCVKPIIYAFVPNELISKDLRNEVVLITGGGSGLGRQIAIKLSVLGCRVVVWDVNENGGRQTVKIIREKGGVGHYYFCDVAKKKDVYTIAQRVKNEVGQVSILINNAGVVSVKSFFQSSDDDIEKTFQVNVISHFWTCKSFLPDMISNNYGHIVTIASVAGYIPLPGLTDYCASKSAAILFHESLHLEIKKHNWTGVNTTLVCPYHINSELFKGFNLKLFSTMEPEYVAEKIVSSIRINEDTVVIPSYFVLFDVLKSVFPISVTTKAIEMMNGFNAADSVIGRDTYKKQIAR